MRRDGRIAFVTRCPNSSVPDRDRYLLPDSSMKSVSDEFASRVTWMASLLEGVPQYFLIKCGSELFAWPTRPRQRNVGVPVD